ncbi:urease accessory protein UreD [Romeria aff. gracilis LEGE 07310]|uniref:Urease accessory protein UreD n=2 Tax=Vasconcelosia TaxID=3366328 RepID=A0A8J7AGD8_9CYAN|nr:urease accessory protein UreD [Romeria aff. gracilis LEGE 07310]
MPLRSYTSAPLRLQRPFYPDDSGSCQSAIVHTAGGMVGGDGLDIQVRFGERSQALVTTTAAHKVYRSSGAVAQQRIDLRLEAGAYGEWLPQETILFSGGRFHQSLRVELGPAAVWTGWEITRFGRSARGERFTAGEWQSATEVWQAGRPLWIDRQRLVGGSAVLDSAHGLAGYPVVGAIAILGHDFDPAQLDSLRALAGGADIGVTSLMKGLLCRYRGTSSQQARQWFTQVWQALRPQLGQSAACPPRVWGPSSKSS